MKRFVKQNRCFFRGGIVESVSPWWMADVAGLTERFTSCMSLVVGVAGFQQEIDAPIGF